MKELYNMSYQKFTPDFIQDKARLDAYFFQNSLSLRKFFNQHREQFQYFTGDKHCLELGCGLGSFTQYLCQEFAQVDAIDISDLAISMAKEIHGESAIKFLQRDALEFVPNQKYDFIFDSHLYHCLTTSNDRLKYLDNIKNWLKDDGIFLMETMVFHERLQIPIDYEFNQDYILRKNINDTYHPVRSVLPSRTIEEEVQQSGMKLNYFYYHDELSFQVFDLYQDYPAEFLPKTIRLSAKLI